MTRLIWTSISVLCALSVTACSTTSGGLAYAPAANIVLADKTHAAPIAVGTFVDQRGEPATWVGAIRGGFGNPLKVVDVTPSVAAAVQTAFADGLRARHFDVSSAGSAFQVSGVITKLDCSQYVRREAHAVIEVNVTETSSGKQVFTQTYTADNLSGSLLTLSAGVFASDADLRAVAQTTLAEVVDKALDDTALRAALHTSAAPVAAR